MKKFFISGSLLITTLALHAGEHDSKQNALALTTSGARQKGLTPVPKLMGAIVHLEKEVRKMPQLSTKSTTPSPVSKDQLLELVLSAKSTFPQLATNSDTAPYMKQAEEIVGDLGNIITIKGSLTEALSLLGKLNTLSENLPKFIAVSTEQTGEIPSFLQLLFALGMPQDQQGAAAKAEILQNVSKVKQPA